MTTWSYPVDMHPWFRKPSLKRKIRDRDSSEGSTGSSSDNSDYEPHPDAPSHSLKRRKCAVLESGFAQLSLNAASKSSGIPQHQSATSGAVDLDQASSQQERQGAEGNLWDKRVNPRVLHPDSVEEPTSPESSLQPELQDVTMKSRSWYEPEKDRIVIVDLDDSDVEDTEPVHNTPQVSVNSAFLRRLKEDRRPNIEPNAASTMALVLFRPLPVPQAEGISSYSQPTKNAESRRLQDEPVMITDTFGRGQNPDTSVEDIDVSPMDVDDPMEIEML